MILLHFYSTLHRGLSLGNTQYFVGARNIKGHYEWLNGDLLPDGNNLRASDPNFQARLCCVRARFDLAEKLLWTGDGIFLRSIVCEKSV